MAINLINLLFKIVYDLKVLPDQVEPAITAVLTAISAPPEADYVVSALSIDFHIVV